MSRHQPAHAPTHCPRGRTALAPRALTVALSLAGATTLGVTPRRADAQVAVLVQGVADAELWKTDSSSVLLTRNNGRPGMLGRLQLWGVAELGPRVVLYAAGYAEGGKARRDDGTEWYTDIAGVRYTHSDAFVVDAGKMLHPVGAFGPRRYSTRNPLVGTPDGYPLQYPVGLQLSGVRGRVDYRAAAVSLPVHNEQYTPEPTARVRPAVGAGFTPTAGVRVGVSATWGPYLNRELPATLLGGQAWHSYAQRVASVDAQLSRGYLELHGEASAARYEVPGDASGGVKVVHGLAYYGEAKYTLTPRFFTAARVERNDYAYIQPVSDAAWLATATNVYNGELGAGYRFGAQTLIKASVRADRWYVPPELRGQLRDGTALALQVSRAFDVIDAAVGARD